MRCIPLVLLLLFVLSSGVAAQAVPPAAGPGLARWTRADTVWRPIRLGLTRLPARVRLDTAMPAFHSLLAPVEFDEYVESLAALREQPLRLGMARPPGDTLGAVAQAVTDTAQATPRLPRTVDFLPPLPPPDTGGPDLLPGALGRYANLGMTVRGHGELGSSWTRYDPCDPSLHLNCRPGLFPQLRPDMQFSVLVGGTISDRLHVNVDYDQTREETLNSNVINVFYQGLPDEVLQRVELGDVQFRLPRSRYLTQGIPAGNFGFMATGQLGPMGFQAVYAQQRGDLMTSEFRLEGAGADGLVQDEQLVLDDADYVQGQFFFLVHPDSLVGSPHIDALLLRATDAPVTLRPDPGGVIEVYRDERIPPASGQQQVNQFLADALSEDGTLRHSGQFRRMEPDQDYVVHSSGLWLMLRRPLSPEEALAISYQTESGTVIGTLRAEQAPPGTTPVLRLLRSPVASHQPGRPTWDFEMHNVYRVNSSGNVDLSSLELRISLGEIVGGRTFVEQAGRQITFLRLFGLDEDAPADRVDPAQVLQPDLLFGAPAQGGARISGTYIVFPTLEPFRAPPPVPSEQLSADDALALLGAEANATIYENTDPVIRDGAGRFRLNVNYRVRIDGIISSFNVGQFGIREGSERIMIGDRRLEPGVDYTMDYEIGQVTLTDPQALFAANPDVPIRVTFEQSALFQIAPTSVFGASASYRLGQRGTLDIVGLYQSEKTLYARPQLGTEPASIFLGGISADVDLGGEWFDRLMQRSPFRSNGGSSVRLTAELATSLPDPNRRDQAWFDDFEGTDETAIDVRRQQWRLGSRPGTNAGDQGLLPGLLDATNAGRLVWQHDLALEGAIGGNLVPQQSIDRQINIIGNQLPESVMYLTFGDGEPAGTQLWRSMTTVLSTTGRDMSRDEYFEFYARDVGAGPLALILDFGTVGEDAFYVDPDGRTNGTYASDGRPWGLGVLDEEARLAEREVWGTQADARGLWDVPCQAQPLQAYPEGDERANCTRGNGVMDTEDLDGNGVLDADDGAYFRYVITLDQLSQYVVRDTMQTGTRFRLYRVPLRDGVPVNGASDGTWRFIKHLRVTVTGDPNGGRRSAVLARLRIVGSRWTKRGLTGIVRGLVDEEPGLGAGITELRAGPVSRLTEGPDYTPPPGVRDELQDPTAQFGGAGIEVNEKSQRIAYTALEPGDRAEIYFRYPQQPRAFMTYRRLRLWAVARRGQWGDGGPERLVVKLGTDPRNTYLYQTKLPAAKPTGPITENDWLPEIRIDFERWFELRAIAEERLVASGGLARDTVWSTDSMYAVVLEDRARAPNLAAIREFAIAVYNGGGLPIDGEVWIDDVRLDRAVQDPGAAGHIALDVVNDAFTARIGYASQGAVFRQLDQDATFVGGGDLTISTMTRLDRMLPASWGLNMPVSVTHSSTARSPSFLERSDVRADGLRGLRDSGGGLTSIGVSLSRTTPSTNPIAAALVDGTTIRFGWDASHANTITSRNESGALRGGIEHRKQLAARDVDIVPGFLESVLRALAPAAIEQSAFFDRLTNARLRWNPVSFGFGTNYNDAHARAFRYQSILAGPNDALLRPIESPRKALDNNANILLQPFNSITASFNMRSVRDLLPPEQATPLPRAQDALRRARASVAGADIGWETNRSMASSLSFRPQLASWLRPSWSFSSRYQTDRNPSYIEIDTSTGDSIALLQRRFGTDRTVTRRLDVMPSQLAQSLGADSMPGLGGALLRTIGAVQSITFSWNTQLASQFDRETFSPSLGYQFGLGGLDSFRAIAGDTAANAAERTDLRAGTLLGLPLGLQFSVDYADSKSAGFDIRGGQRTHRQTSWPNLRVGWDRIPLPGFLGNVIRSAAAGTRYEVVERTSTYGIASPLPRGLEETTLSPDLRLSFAGGLSAAWTSTWRRGHVLDPTGDGEQDGTSHSVTLAGLIQPPGFLREKMRNPINLSFVFAQDEQSRCRFMPATSPDGGAQCVAFLDTSNRSANFTLDTILSDINVGMRFNYTNRQNRVGTQTGSSQFQFAVFGSFRFQSGQLPMGR